MSITRLNERPSARAAACAHAHVYGVGRVAVTGLPDHQWRLTGQLAALGNELSRRQSVQLKQSVQFKRFVQLNDAQVRFEGTNGRTAKAIRMVQIPLMAGVEASGVPPRGRPV